MTIHRPLIQQNLRSCQSLRHLPLHLHTFEPDYVPWLYFSEDKARPHAAGVAMNCLTACQTLPWPFNRAYLRYDGKVTASTME
ncbi:hypothetical protein TNCV_4292291 [Trichonephila clavipes]|uniref:Uncharacterized protein n=1 Tax=Trichonephila clavipes TaxID=2585209 RepID=A0A8X6V5S6_TRICX|nr:hypothetical protein TNCV_4292291 [Trichonephila clavipes]